MTSISVVTPSLNQAQFLPDALESVQQQGTTNVEHLVLDGGSSDGTLSLLRKLDGQPQWSHLRWLTAPDQGQSDALNRGFAQAKGDIVGWLNADDRYRPGCFAAVRRAFAEDPDLDVLYGDVAEIDVNGDLHHIRREIGFSRFILLYHHVLYIPTPSTFFRRRVFDEGNWLRTDLHYAMDYEFFVRLAQQQYKIGRVPHVLADFRIHAQSKSTRMSHTQASEMEAIRLSRSPIAQRLHNERACHAAHFGLMLAAAGLRRTWKLLRGDYFTSAAAPRVEGGVS